MKKLNSSEDTNNTKEITYYSTDKNSFITTRIPKNIKIVTKKHNSCTYIDYDINTYYKNKNKNKHISNNSYFTHYPNTIINYKNKLQETGLTLENNQHIINEINTIDETETIDDLDTIDENENENNENNVDEVVDSSDIINDYLFQDNRRFINIEQSKRADMYTFYSTLNKNNDNKTWSIYSNLN